MNFVAVVIALAALACFVIDIVRSKGKSPVAWGLALFVAAFIVTFVFQPSDPSWSWVIH